MQDLPTLVELCEKNPAWLDELVPPDEAARIVRSTPTGLATRRSRGIGPPYVKFGSGSNGPVWYRRRDLFEWIAQHVRRNTADPGQAA